MTLETSRLRFTGVTGGPLRITGATLVNGAYELATAGGADYELQTERQTTMDNILFIPGLSPRFSLQRFPGAVAAYSLTLVSSAYSGPCLRVRRASDSEEQDILFVGGAIDIASLETFCSGTDGFVTTWHDQSGNGNHVSQATTGNQPQIVTSGSIVRQDGKICVSTNGTSQFLSRAAFATSAPLSIWVAAANMNTPPATANTSTVTFSNSAVQGASLGAGFRAGAASAFVFQGTTFTNTLSGSPPEGKFALSTSIFNISGPDTQATSWLNSGSQNTISNTTPTGINTFAIGSLLRPTPVFYVGRFGSVIVYPVNQSAQRAAIDQSLRIMWSI
jgi:hypothetical protein